MAADSAIEWTDKTWTPIVGCDAVSPACANCYAALMATRLEAMGQEKYRGVATRVGNKGKWAGRINLWEPEVLAPLSVRKPKRWFLTSMGDVFHDGVPFAFIDRLFAVMALTPHHTYYVLTKRADRAANYAAGLHDEPHRDTVRRLAAALPPHVPIPDAGITIPLPNVLIGCTAEDQPRADARRQHMERIASAGWQTFVSYEPALGMVDWAGWEFLSWLISGGESGHGARPSHPDWHRAARDFCAAHGIPYMMKQWGEYLPAGQRLGITLGTDADGREIDMGSALRTGQAIAMSNLWTYRVGKKAAGRLLDGREHTEFPA